MRQRAVWIQEKTRRFPAATLFAGCQLTLLERPLSSADDPHRDSFRRTRRGEQALVAPYKGILFSWVPDSFELLFAHRYCTVTTVPTGISEKNLRAVSSGNRMQPCDAGRFGT